MAGKKILVRVAALSALTMTALTMTAPAAAQRSEATIYRDANFSGPAMFIDRANPNLGLAWPVRSIRVPAGNWELCPQTNFRGTCMIIGQNTADLRRAYGWAGPLQSMRPLNQGGGGGNGGGGGGTYPGSLRGMASEFFPAPRSGNSRVLACRNNNATANCAADTADRFCRSVGWRGALHQTMQSERNRVYLADVLCANAGV